MKVKITQQLLKSLRATGAGYDVNETELPGLALRVASSTRIWYQGPRTGFDQ